MANCREVFRDLLVAELSSSDELIIVERADLEKVLEELYLSMTAYVDSRAAIEIGRMLGAQLLTIGKLKKGRTGLAVDARLVEPETARVFKVRALEAEDWGKLAKETAREIQNSLSERTEKDTITVAMLGFESKDRFKRFRDLENVLADRVEAALCDVPGIRVLERRAVKTLIEEIELGETGLVSQDTAAKAGNALSADILLVGSFTEKIESGMSLEDSRLQIEVDIRDGTTGDCKDRIVVDGRPADLSELGNRLLKIICQKLRIPRSRTDVSQLSKSNLEACLLHSKALEVIRLVKGEWGLGPQGSEVKEGLESASHILEKALYLDPYLVAARMKLAEVLDDIGRDKEAIKHWKKLVTLCPESEYCPRALHSIGGHYFYGMGNVKKSIDQAIEAYEKLAFEYKGEQIGAVYKLSEAYDMKIQECIKNKNSNLERVYMKKLQLVDDMLLNLYPKRSVSAPFGNCPADCAVHFRRARTYRKAGDYKKALSEFSHIIENKLYRGHFTQLTLRRMYVCMADIYENELNDYHEAIRIFNMILDSEPGDDNILRHVARCYRKMGERKKFYKTEIKRAELEMKDGSPFWFKTLANVHKSVGDAFFEAGFRKAAARCYEKYLSFYDYDYLLRNTNSATAEPSHVISRLKSLKVFWWKPARPWFDKMIATVCGNARAAFLDKGCLWVVDWDEVTMFDEKRHRHRICSLPGKIKRTMTEGGNKGTEMMITDMAVNDMYIWICTRDAGIFRFDRESQTWKQFTGRDVLPSDIINCVAVQRDIAWFGAGKGIGALISFDKNKDTWNVYYDKLATGTGISAIKVDGDELWVGTIETMQSRRGHISRFNTKNKTWVLEQTGMKFIETVNTIDVDSKSVWFAIKCGGSKNILRYSKVKGTWKRYPLDLRDVARLGMARHSIPCLASDGKNLWVGTPDGDLLRYDILSNHWVPVLYRRLPGSPVIRSIKMVENGLYLFDSRERIRFVSKPLLVIDPIVEEAWQTTVLMPASSKTTTWK